MIITVLEVCEVYEVLMIVTEDHYPLGCAPVWYKSTQVTEGCLVGILSAAILNTTKMA
jgi:hypothetical protein